MSEAAAGIGITLGVLGFAGIIVAIVACTKCFKCVQEKEVIIIERCGKYKTTLVPGIHCIVPFCDAPRVCCVVTDLALAHTHTHTHTNLCTNNKK